MKIKIYSIEACFILLIFLNLSCTSKKYYLESERKIYLEKAKIKPAFITLPPGSVTPSGWIKDWAEAAAQGITGHLDEYSTAFAEAWKGQGFEARGVGPDGTGWPLEQGSYWLDGAVRLAYILKDTALIRKVSKRLDYVVNGVLNGGESFIYWKNTKGLLIDSSRALPSEASLQSFNNWAHSHMGRALVAYYQATHDKRILKALVKVYKQFPVGDLWSDFSDVSGACNIDPMIDTYLMSGDQTILDSILSFSNRTSYKDVAGRWSKGNLTPGHNVVYYEDIRVPALLYDWTGNKTDLDASLKAIEWGEKNYLLPVGVLSGEEWQAGIGATRNIETCDVSTSEWTFLQMLRITGDKNFSDRIEKIFFNAAAAPVDREFKTMCYYQSLNRYSSSLPGVKPTHPSVENSYEYTKIGCEVLCCIGNLNRIIPNYIMNMWMATMDHGLAATLYGPCKLHTKIAKDISVNIDCQTSYPFGELINMTIDPEKEIRFPLYLRVPEWCQNPEIKVNGTAVDCQQKGKDFIKISRLWKKNDKITLHFPMNVEIVKGRETPYPQVSYFDKGRIIAKDTTINNPYECVYYGPLLFSLAIPDQNPNKRMPNVKFNYALDVNPNNVAGQIEVIRKAMPVKWDWSPNAPIQLRVKAKEFDWEPTENQPLPFEPVKGKISAQINLVPYGCTKFRVTMFPVTKASWSSF
jgi:uncharacterized protein